MKSEKELMKLSDGRGEPMMFSTGIINVLEQRGWVLANDDKNDAQEEVRDKEDGEIAVADEATRGESTLPHKGKRKSS